MGLTNLFPTCTTLDSVKEPRSPFLLLSLSGFRRPPRTTYLRPLRQCIPLHSGGLHPSSPTFVSSSTRRRLTSRPLWTISTPYDRKIPTQTAVHTVVPFHQLRWRLPTDGTPDTSDTSTLTRLHPSRPHPTTTQTPHRRLGAMESHVSTSAMTPPTGGPCPTSPPSRTTTGPDLPPHPTLRLSWTIFSVVNFTPSLLNQSQSTPFSEDHFGSDVRVLLDPTLRHDSPTPVGLLYPNLLLLTGVSPPHVNIRPYCHFLFLRGWMEDRATSQIYTGNSRPCQDPLQNPSPVHHPIPVSVLLDPLPRPSTRETTTQSTEFTGSSEPTLTPSPPSDSPDCKTTTEVPGPSLLYPTEVTGPETIPPLDPEPT